MEESNSWPERTGNRSAETAETLGKLRAQADDSLHASRRHLSAIETDLNRHIQQVASELARDLVEACPPAETAPQEGLSAQIDQLTAQLEQEALLRDQLQESLAGLNQEKDQLQQQFQEQTDKLQQQQASQDSERQHLEQQWEQANRQIQELVAERDQACQALRELQAQPCAECEQLQQRVAQLEQQRLEVDTQQAAERDRLRGQRDALATRVAELEAAAPAAADPSQEEQIADLKQRYKMAVDDLQQLKQENADLQTQIAARLADPSAPLDEGPLDWQAQKARLLASLEEDEGEALSEQRQQERMTIEGTLSVTDRVVADKDQDIAELHQQLNALQADLAQAQQAAEEQAEQVQQDPRETILADDEIIQQERNRLVQLQQEWEEKLRQAELAISVERATLAREHADLEKKLSMVQELSAESKTGSRDQRPHRRWLAALGIKGEDEDA